MTCLCRINKKCYQSHDIKKIYSITGNFCGYIISAVFCGQFWTEEIKRAEYYVK